jgi:phosphate transport system substrate-binding protein
VKIHFRCTTVVLASLLLLTFVNACGRVPAEGIKSTITVSGAWALYPMMVRWAEEYQKSNPSVLIDVSAGGAGKGIADTLSGAADIGMVSRDLSAEEVAQGAFGVAVTKDAVFPMINAKNPVLDELLKRGVSRDTLIGVYITGQVTSWGQVINNPAVNAEINVYTRSDACGAAEMWAKYLGGNKQEDLLGIGVYGDPGILEAVIKDPSGIGFNNLNYAFDAATGLPVAGAMEMPIDINGNGQVDAEEKLDTKAKAIEAIATGRYPSPPARALFLVTRGKPTGPVRDLLLWILTEGQQYVDEVGYIQLPKEQLQAELQKVR